MLPVELDTPRWVHLVATSLPPAGAWLEMVRATGERVPLYITSEREVEEEDPADMLHLHADPTS